MISGVGLQSTISWRSTARELSTTTAITSSPVNASSFISSLSDDQRTLVQVEAETRAVLDAGYGKLGKTGDDSTTGKEWKETVGLQNLDRRQLYSIIHNASGQFSEAEQSAASWEMGMRTSAAMAAADPIRTSSAGWKAAVLFLDEAGPEEKASFQWAQQRASTQWGYEQLCYDEGKTPEDLESEFSVVRLLLEAWREFANRHDASKKVEDMPQFHEALQQYAFDQEDDRTSLSFTL